VLPSARTSITVLASARTSITVLPNARTSIAPTSIAVHLRIALIPITPIMIVEFFRRIAR
jgi:hypothetical protein